MQPDRSAIPRRRLLGGLAAAASLGLPAWRARATNALADVLVLGAGISGLHAARLLQQAGATVQVLEGSPRIGGRCWTARSVPGSPEFGAGTVGAGYGRVRGNAAELGVALVPPAPGGRETTGRGRQAYSIGGAPASAEPWVTSPLNRLASHEKAMSPLQLYRHYVNLNMPLKELGDWLTPAFAPLDRQSLRAYFSAQGASPEALRLLNIHVPAANLDDANALHFIRINFVYQFEDRAGPPLKVRGGTSTLTDAMAASLARPVQVNKVVTRIQAEPKRVTVTCADGSSATARACITTIPPAVMKSLRIDGPVPAAQRAAWSALRSTSVVQVYFSAKTPFWERDGLPPAMWTDGPIEQLFHLPAEGSHGTLVAFISGDGTAALDKMTPQAAGEAIHGELVRIRPAAAGELTVEHVHNWATYPFNQGHIASHAPGDIARLQPLLRQPAGALYFAGDHCGQLHVGLEAACEAGEAAALQVLGDIKT